MKTRSGHKGHFVLFALLLVLTIGCQLFSPTEKPVPTTETPPTAVVETPPTAELTPETPETLPPDIPVVQPRAKSVFAPYQPQPVNVTPALDQPAIAPDLSNVHVPMPLSADQLARLARDGVAASPGLQ